LAKILQRAFKRYYLLILLSLFKIVLRRKTAYFYFFISLSAAMLFSEVAQAQFYNGTQTEFGKNRVQYDDFQWQFYKFDKFETYFYTGGKDLAKYTANYANVRIKEIEKFLDFYLDEPIQFIIYNKQSHFRQSNIGLSTNPNYNIGGVTRIVGNKLFVYFEGDYDKFTKQLDAGMMQVLIYQMIYGGNWREVLSNSALLHLPEWYINGLVSYLSNPDDPLVNAKIKDGIKQEKFKKFNGLANEEAKIAGHAMWQYIAEVYGENVISNILYMTRISREIDDGFLYVIGVPFDELYQGWIEYFNNKFKANQAATSPKDLGEKVEFKIRKNRRYQNFKSSPNGDYIAYTTNKLGKYKVFLYDQKQSKRIKIFVNEHKLDRIQDYSYPVLAWHPSGELVSFVIEDKGNLLLYSYNIKDEMLSVKSLFKLEKVLSLSYFNDGRQMVFSAFNEGKTDLYLYNTLGNTQKKITDDFYDDLSPQISADGEKIFFISNRPNDSLNTEHEVDRYRHETDVFVYDLLNDETPISSVTDTEDKNETSPLTVGDELYYIISEPTLTRRFRAKFDSSISRIDTSIHYNYFYRSTEVHTYDKVLLEQSSENSKTIDQIFFEKGRYALYSKDLISQAEQDSTLKGGHGKTTTMEEGKVEKEGFLVFDEINPSKEVDIYNYEFSPNDKPSKDLKLTKDESASIASKKEIEPLEFPTQRLYRLNFRVDESVLQLNNTFINGQYQLFNGGPFINSGLGINTKIGIVDLMEDHRVYGGFRYSGDLIEYSLSYQNLKKRLDKEFMITRSRERNEDGPFPFDVKTLRGVGSFSWPFSEVTSLRGVAEIRNDKVIPLSSNLQNLELDIFNEYWASLKLAYVFDNTRDIALNIKYGTRFKIFAEQYQMVYSEQDDSESSDLTVVGFDFRHYQKIHREFIYVGRIAGSKSFGSNPLIYYLGGVDEWWKSDIFNENTPIDFSQNFGFQALAANMRGFLQNIRNGSSFMLINQELRLPVFSYFINRPIQSDFVRDFQIIGFGDVGTAWTGGSPYDDDNPLNNETRVNGPITVTYEDINDPLVAGFGFGLRTSLLGYFVRADWAWGVENGEVSDDSMFIFSLSLDI